MLKALIAAACVLGAFAEQGIGSDVSLKGEHVELSKDAQKAEWMDLKDEKYNSKGFYQWKAQPEGFILKNKDSTLVTCKVKSKNPIEGKIKVDFDCNEKAAASDGEVVDSALSAHARFRAKLKQKFTPIQEGHKLKPLDPDLQFTFEQDGHQGASSGTWGRDVNIDDSVFEGETNNAFQDIEQASEKDEKLEQEFLDKVDVGPGDLFHDEEAKEQTHKKYNKVIRKSKRESSHVPHANMVDTPYVDAGVDREVNDRMYEFFKKHPQYHAPEAHWRAARKWKGILASSENSENIPGQEGGQGQSMWSHNSCDDDSKVPAGWPDVPTMKCRHYAVSPMGYWGCQWLFEDGTCGYIQYYPTIRWDGLDSYRTKHHDPADKALEHKGIFQN